MFQPVDPGARGPFEIAALDPAGHVVSIPITVSDDGLRTVTLDVRLIEKSWSGVSVHELKFLYVVQNVETGKPEEIYDRDKAVPYVQPVKGMIMQWVCEAATMLIEHVQPPIIFRATFAEHPPEKALHKHQMITDTIQKLGYREPWVGSDDYHRVLWVMTRAETNDGQEKGR